MQSEFLQLEAPEELLRIAKTAVRRIEFMKLFIRKDIYHKWY